jgi:hypothetical protein
VGVGVASFVLVGVAFLFAVVLAPQAANISRRAGTTREKSNLDFFIKKSLLTIWGSHYQEIGVIAPLQI